MEPVMIVGTTVLRTIVSRATTGLMSIKTDLSEEDILDELVAIGGDASTDPELIVDGQQYQILIRALERQEAGRIIQAFVIGRLTLPKADLDSLRTSCIESLRKCIQIEAGSAWSQAGDAAEVAWRQIEQFIKDIGPRGKEALVVAASLLTSTTSRTGDQLLEGASKPTPAFFRNLMDITESTERMIRCRNLASDIRHEIAVGSRHMNLTHLPEGEIRFDRDSLYVERTLLSADGSLTISTADLPIFANNAGRVVILGHPGVGKTTLVNHIVRLAALNTTENCAPILVSCRNYADSKESDITGWAAKQSSISDHASREDLSALLTLGRAVVLFDGIDEVIDLHHRVQLVSEIEIFSQRYPLCPIVVTSRRVGYRRAAFNAAFEDYDLIEFSDAQVDRYVNTWFSLRNSSEKVPSFLRDSRTVEDIRNNPLMLSLLCDLYRANGYIPRNRREIYQACADLLFNRWDAMRDIQQPMDHRSYGDRLFQELAMWFHKSQAARSGLEERQLLKVIAGYFERNLSVDPSDSRKRAADFLEFCADRAWLLSSAGQTDRGERIFGFTHRTFLEYYAAVAIVRRAATIEEIVSEVHDAFVQDPGSVLCDVLTQCADTKFEDGGAQVLEGLLRELDRDSSASEALLALCLRIADSIPIPKFTMKHLIKQVERVWRRLSAAESEASSTALFSLNRDARRSILAFAGEAGGGDQTDHFVDSLVTRWSWLDLLHLTRFADSGWKPDIDTLITSRLEGGGGVTSEEIAYGVKHGLYPADALKNMQKSECLVLKPFGKAVPGPLMDALFVGGAAQWPDGAGPVLASLSHDWKAWVNLREGIPFDYGVGIADALEGAHFRGCRSDAPAELVIWLCFVVQEVEENVGAYLELLVGGRLGSSLLSLCFESRQFAQTGDSGGRYEFEESNEEEQFRLQLTGDLDRSLKLAGLNRVRWIKRWVEGSISLVR